MIALVLWYILCFVFFHLPTVSIYLKKLILHSSYVVTVFSVMTQWYFYLFDQELKTWCSCQTIFIVNACFSCLNWNSFVLAIDIHYFIFSCTYLTKCISLWGWLSNGKCCASILSTPALKLFALILFYLRQMVLELNLSGLLSRKR